MTKYGTLTLPHVLTVQDVTGEQALETPIPSAAVPYRRWIAGLGHTFEITGELRSDIELTRDKIVRLADGTARILDFEFDSLTTGAEWSALEEALRYESTPTWTDDTIEAESAAGTPFTLLGGSTDYFYFGHREKFNKLYFDVQTAGSYGARTWEYSQGASSWAVITLDSDGASGFAQDGSVVITPPSDWQRDTVDSITKKFWLRVSVASVTTVATINQIKTNLVYNCLLYSPRFGRAVEDPRKIPYDLTFAQQENP